MTLRQSSRRDNRAQTLFASRPRRALSRGSRPRRSAEGGEPDDAREQRCEEHRTPRRKNSFTAPKEFRGWKIRRDVIRQGRLDRGVAAAPVTMTRTQRTDPWRRAPYQAAFGAMKNPRTRQAPGMIGLPAGTISSLRRLKRNRQGKRNAARFRRDSLDGLSSLAARQRPPAADSYPVNGDDLGGG